MEILYLNYIIKRPNSIYLLIGYGYLNAVLKNSNTYVKLNISNHMITHSDICL